MRKYMKNNKTKKVKEKKITFPMFLAQLIGGRPKDIKIEKVSYSTSGRKVYDK